MIVILLSIIVAICGQASGTLAAYPPSFGNHSGCLYSYMEEGKYHIVLPEAESESGIIPVDKILYDNDKTKCTDGIHPGTLSIIFNIQDNFVIKMTLDLTIRNYPSEGYWEISGATLNIVGVNPEMFKPSVYELKTVDMYAGDKFSFSCNQLVLTNKNPLKGMAQFKITLNRFQLQPFGELQKEVFAPSYDCSVWITLPLLMGLIFMLFLTFTVMIGVYLLLEQGNQTLKSCVILNSPKERDVLTPTATR